MSKFKSKPEVQVSQLLKQNNLPSNYEPDRLKYTVIHTYTPDFKINDNFYIEVKGRWTGADRTKHKYVRQQHPGLILLIAFQDPNRRLTKTSTTSYAQFCDKQGWPWCSLKNLIETINKYYV